MSVKQEYRPVKTLRAELARLEKELEEARSELGLAKEVVARATAVVEIYEAGRQQFIDAINFVEIAMHARDAEVAFQARQATTPEVPS